MSAAPSGFSASITLRLPPAENPSTPIRSGLIPHSPPRALNSLIACRASSSGYTCGLAGSRLGTRYFNNTAVTPSEFNHSHTCVPSCSIAKIEYPPPGQTSTAVPFAPVSGRYTVIIGTETFPTRFTPSFFLFSINPSGSDTKPAGSSAPSGNNVTSTGSTAACAIAPNIVTTPIHFQIIGKFMSNLQHALHPHSFITQTPLDPAPASPIMQRSHATRRLPSSSTQSTALRSQGRTRSCLSPSASSS